MNVPRRALLALGIGASLIGQSAAGDGPSASAVEPDRPLGFGYKLCWFAVRTQDGAAVAKRLGLVDQRPANWKAGVAAAYDAIRIGTAAAEVFVTPPVDGWTLAASVHLPYPADADSHEANLQIGRRFRVLFRKLSDRFDDVQFFGTHRVVGFDAWARARHRRIERVFSYTDGEVTTNEGPQTVEEAALGFLDLGERSPMEATALIAERLEKDLGAGGDKRKAERRRDARGRPASFHGQPLPSEHHTIALAGAWSVDPTILDERGGPFGIGIVGRLPED
jgi:hypothetical protein